MKTILGKPSGITLEDHVAHVIVEVQALLQTYPFAIDKYAQLSNGKNLSKWLLAAAKYHDDGKNHQKWQNACQLDYQAYLTWRARRGGGSFKDFERDQPELAGKHLREAGIRHEIASVWMHRDHDFALPVTVAIAAHHAKLSNRHEQRWQKDLGEEGEKLWNTFKRESVQGLDSSVAAFHEFRKFLVRYPAISGVRAWLVTADQRASGKEAGEDLPPLCMFRYKFPHHKRRSVQQIVEDHWRDDFLLVRAPTGAGKTDAALLWAKKQIENGLASRLVIAMPTRFTSNALSINVAESLSETGLYHSSAWFAKFQKRVEKGEVQRQTARNEHEFARRLLTPITVCTIDHLLMALTLTREDHHQILFNLMNSCLVIDEADFYDEFTQANILALLEAIHVWKVPVMLMSASLPESSRTFYERSGYQIPEIREDKSDLTRPRCRINSIIKAEVIADFEDRLEECRERGAAIIYANTVARAMEYYDWFKAKGEHPILYHSRFTEPDKLKKEGELLAALGKNGVGNGIAILTQIGEMSVNISADLMLTDICPIDRLVQRVGRLSRFDPNKVGCLYVVIPQKNGMLYPAPYGEYKRPNWIAHRALLETVEKIQTDTLYSAGDFVRLINEIYPNEATFEVKARKNAENLREYFVNNWMIASQEMSKEDDDKTSFWKSRDIEANEEVFWEPPTILRFSSWISFQAFKNENVINIHPYLVKIGLEKTFSLAQKEIFVEDSKITITYVQNPMAYSFEKGLNIETGYDQYL